MPRLYILALTFDAIDIPPIDISLPQDKLETLDVSFSRSSDNGVTITAPYISSISPNLTEIWTDEGCGMTRLDDSIGSAGRR
jgi:hypothetical protein